MIVKRHQRELFVLMHNTTVLTAATHMFFVFVFNTLAVIPLENGHFTIHVHLILMFSLFRSVVRPETAYCTSLFNV